MSNKRGTKWQFNQLLLAPTTILSMISAQRLNSAGLGRHQDKKLRAIIRHSYDHVQYYHFLFNKAKLKPDDIKSAADLHKIPASTKKDVKNLPIKDTTATNIELRKCSTWSTSGTSGVSLITYWEKKAMMMQYIENYLIQMDCGNRITDRQAVIGADWIPRHPIQKLGMFRTKQISPFDTLDQQIEQMRQFTPKALTCYPSCARVLAKEIRDKNIPNIRIPLIFTGGENLDDYTRKLVEDTFEANVFDAYGANEVGGVSLECTKHCGYHIWADLVIVEILRDGEQVSTGEVGELTVTNLTNRAMPFIRYNLKDEGLLIPDECSCGSHFPMMKILQGRKSDVIHLSDGRIVSALAVYCRLGPVPGIKQFQLVQEKLDRFTVKVIKETRFENKTTDEIKRILQESLGNAEVDVLFVDDIPKQGAGKLAPFTSNVH